MNTLNAKLNVVPSVLTAPGHSQKNEISPGAAGCTYKRDILKPVKSVSCVIPLSYVNPVLNAPNVVTNRPVGARLQEFWKNWLALGAGPKVVQILKEGYTLPFRIRLNLSRTPSHKLLWQSSQKSQTGRGITSAYRQKRHRTSSQKGLTRFLQPAISSSKTRQQVETDLRSKQPESFPQDRKIQDGDTGNHRNISPKGRMGNLHRLQRRFHIPIQERSRKYLRFYIQGQTYQFKALPFGLSTAPMEFTIIAKEVKLIAIHKGIRIHQYLDDWLVRATSHQACLQHTQVLVKMCQRLGWLVNVEKSELEPKQVFNFVGYQFDLESGCVRPTPDRWQSLQDKILTLISLPACSVREFMSLIGLLTATEKQVHLGRLHMRPIQLHLKSNWIIPESLEKQIPLPRSLHPHLQWWLKEDNVLTGQLLHPMQHALQIFTDASKEGWGAHLNEFIARGTWSLPESKLHINYLELKAVFLAPKSMHRKDGSSSNQQHYSSCLHQQGGRHEVGPTLCPTLENLDLVHRETSDSEGPTHSRLLKCSGRQTVPTGTNHPEGMVPPARGFPGPVRQVAPASNRSLCYEIQQQGAPAVDALSVSWEDLDTYAFPPTAILGKVVEKLQDSPYRRLIIIAPGWPNMTWFWDLVEMSSRIPLLLPQMPNLLTQPFNQTPHRSLTNLNLHAWLLEPQLSRSRVSLRQWQQELRLLKEDQPDPSVRQSGPFLQSGAS